MFRTPTSVGRQRGFSIVEVIVVVAIIAILAAIAIPLVSRWIAVYRLGIASQMVSDQLQAAKMQAVAKTRRYSLLFDVQGNRLGREGMQLVDLPPGVRFDQGESGVLPVTGVATDGPVTFPALPEDSSLRAASFTGRGLPDADPGETFAVFVTNTTGTQVIVMTSAGNIRVLDWRDGEWK